MSVRPADTNSIKVSQSSSLSLVSLRSFSDLSQVSLGSLLAFLAYFVGPTEPKILRLVVLDCGYFFIFFCEEILGE